MPNRLSSPLFFHASKNEGCEVSGQDTLNISHLSAFEMLDMCREHLGTALFRSWISCSNPHHLDRRAIRLELEFIFRPLSIGGNTRDAGHLLCREISNLLTRASR